MDEKFTHDYLFNADWCATDARLALDRALYTIADMLELAEKEKDR